MKIVNFFITLGVLTLFLSAVAYAQFPVVSAEDVNAWMNGTKKFVLIDTRNPDEYIAGHIPGAVNIPADRVKMKKTRLPKDPSMPVIFYCRGVG